jgi:hypothetical protein
MTRTSLREHRRATRVLVFGATLLAGGLLLLVAASPWPHSPAKAAPKSASAQAPWPALLTPVEPAFTPPEPAPLRGGGAGSWWAPVRRPVIVRAAPNVRAPDVARLSPVTPEQTTNLVLVLGRAEDDAGRIWIHARLAILPNNTTGWVPRDALGGYTNVRTRLVIDLESLTATLSRKGRPIFHADVGVGTTQWPTPRGEFFIRNRLTAYSSPFYGPLAFGTSARSDRLTDWPAGGFVGIHGTNRPELIPGRVSHGCIRMRNRDILTLGRLMPVGTPVTIR